MSLAGSALEAALQAVGRGLDAAGDHRMLYCKGAGRLVALEEDRARDLPLPDGGVLPSVPPDVEVEQCHRESQRIRNFPYDPGSAVADAPFVCSFDKMAEYFNGKSGLSETVPLGYFNSLFSFTGSWKNDAAVTKALAIDGYSLPLFRVKIRSSELTLLESVKRAIPNVWDPSALARSVGSISDQSHSVELLA
ncbi:unnamed protein product [Miscanthus lutarioriparius]|uniref:MACPF domain-containing protein n=1 Tax=Miscanthus lutarioriparius TaxID=422564 RepID=A0A811QFY4_9POAL|nr:unnamed protein product [Miscanthus lutarioriparius]